MMMVGTGPDRGRAPASLAVKSRARLGGCAGATGASLRITGCGGFLLGATITPADRERVCVSFPVSPGLGFAGATGAALAAAGDGSFVRASRVAKVAGCCSFVEAATVGAVDCFTSPIYCLA